MIQHVSIEATFDEMDMCVRFYERLGFREVPPPEELVERTRWLQSGPSQIHLIEEEDPQRGMSTHFAVLVDDYDSVFEDLTGLGFAPESRTEYWGSPRALVRDPAGNLVEFMASAP